MELARFSFEMAYERRIQQRDFKDDEDNDNNDGDANKIVDSNGGDRNVNVLIIIFVNNDTCLLQCFSSVNRNVLRLNLVSHTRH